MNIPIHLFNVAIALQTNEVKFILNVLGSHHQYLQGELETSRLQVAFGENSTQTEAASADYFRVLAELEYIEAMARRIRQDLNRFRIAPRGEPSVDQSEG